MGFEQRRKIYDESKYKLKFSRPLASLGYHSFEVINREKITTDLVSYIKSKLHLFSHGWQYYENKKSVACAGDDWISRLPKTAISLR